MLQKIKKALNNPRLLGVYLLSKFAVLFPDKLYLKLMFRLKIGYWMDFDNPQTFNEKLQWLKLYNRQPVYTHMVDKYAVKRYVADMTGEEYLIPTIGVWDSVDRIDFDSLPNQFVLKTTHGGGGGGVVICKDKSHFDIEQCKIKLQHSLETCIYRNLREWPYKDVPCRVIAEQYMVDESGYELKDYKFFCFNGNVKIVKVDFNRQTLHRANYYSKDFDLLPFGEEVCPPNLDIVHSKPYNFEAMVETAERLASHIPFCRVDLYNVNGKIYFGEITFFPASGFGPFTETEWDHTLGSWLVLPEKQN
jgi:hypothetical protein